LAEDAIVVQAYDEDIAAWANAQSLCVAFALWMQQRKLEQVGFVELLDEVRFPVVKGWLAVLLDEGFAMDRLEGSEFYKSAGILVELKRDEIAESLCEAIAC
jgi:hypothetical protein